MLDLLDYRQRVFKMYRIVRASSDPPAQVWEQFCAAKDDLFRTHSQSALDDNQKARFEGLAYYPYDAAYRVKAAIETDVERQTYDYELGADGAFTMTRIGTVQFTLPTGTGRLSLYWIEGYGGGVFLPFKDATSGEATYGGGRYLYDTIKGADLGATPDTLLLDFNYAYHPSCTYNARWVCPLAPPENQLSIAVPAGEQLPSDDLIKGAS